MAARNILRLATRKLFTNSTAWGPLASSVPMQIVRCISVTKKGNEQSISIPVDGNVIKPRVPSISDPLKDESHLPPDEQERNWIAFGEDASSKEDDDFTRHSITFGFVGVFIVFSSFYFMYVLPDWKLIEWSRREAFLELDRREQLGLELINPNYIDPKTMNLPSEEELGDFELVI